LSFILKQKFKIEFLEDGTINQFIFDSNIHRDGYVTRQNSKRTHRKDANGKLNTPRYIYDCIDQTPELLTQRIPVGPSNKSLDYLCEELDI
jgi:hypothetical protein